MTITSNQGPQVFSRPGTKKHAKQVRARAAYFAIQAVYSQGAAKRAAERVDAARAEHDAAVAAENARANRSGLDAVAGRYPGRGLRLKIIHSRVDFGLTALYQRNTL